MLIINPDYILSTVKGNQSLSVLFALSKDMGDNFISTLSIAQICDQTGLCRQSVSKHLNELNKLNAIEILKDKSDSRKNVYRINDGWVSSSI